MTSRQQGNRDLLAGEQVLARLRDALPVIPAWLATRRWFADKGRAITSADLLDVLVDRVDDDGLALSVVLVRFTDGDSALYLLPLAVTASPGEASVVDGESPQAIVDATETPWFGGWLIDRLLSEDGASGQKWTFAPAPSARATLNAARSTPGTLMRGEQSNSSLRFGDDLIVKIVRRLQPGTNPDQEVLRSLATVRFAHVPPYAGMAAWRSADGAEYPFLLAQAFVPNVGDGWSWMLARLADIAAGRVDVEKDPLLPERLLGQRTGELHVALSQVADADFAPEPARHADIAADAQRVENAAGAAAGLILERESELPAALRAQLPAAIEALRGVSERARGFRDETQTRRIRVHGDYHLGQVLRTPDGDWTIIDFEGEPARPVSERRRKTSALKDVAGMLRSFAYARGVAARAVSDVEREMALARLDRWEQAARRDFLAGYRDALVASAVPLAPTDDAAIARALDAWELDKALYEIAYEARNRPDWLEIPLRAFLPGVGDQSPEETGGAPA